MLEEASADAPSPRAATITIGYAFQPIGMVLMMGGCCFGAISGSVLPASDQPIDHWAEFFSPGQAFGAAMTIGTLTTGIGGLALVAVGIGLQGEHPKSGWAGLVVTGAMTVIYALVTAVLFWRTQSGIASISAGVFTVGSLVLLCLAAHAARVLKLNPPPADRSKVTDEELQEMRDRRRRRYE